MKKILVFLMMMICLSANAQTAVETPKTFDNVYAGAQMGISTPMSFNSTFPLNTYFGVKIGKNITPIVGFNIEGDMWFGSATNKQGRFSYKNGIRATNIGLNATIDMFNWFGGYKPNRTFTIIPEAGLGWLHSFNSNASDFNDLSAKTGVQFAWNVGKAWQLYAEPTVWWNLTKNKKLEFNKNCSQLGIQVGFIYKFKNSNKTHNFVVHDIGELNREINYLHAQVDSLENIKPEIKIVKDVMVQIDTIKEVSYAAPFFVCFAQNSSELTEEAKNVLNNIPDDVIVNIQATASPEGTKKYNKSLSERRAETVAKYLTNRGIKVSSSEGIGVTNKSSNRIAIITVAQ